VAWNKRVSTKKSVGIAISKKVEFDHLVAYNLQSIFTLY